MKTPDLSLPYVEDVLRKEPHNAEAWRIKGDIFLHDIKLYDALTSYSFSIKNDPNYQLAWIGKGITSLLINNNIDAKQCFDKSLFLSENHKCDLYRYISHSFLWNKSNFNKINKFLKKSEDCDSHNIFTNISLGNLYETAGNFSDAKKYFQKAQYVDSKNFSSLFHLNFLGKRTISTSELSKFLSENNIDDDEIEKISNRLFLDFDFMTCKSLYEYLLSQQRNLQILKKYALICLIRNDVSTSLDCIDEFLSNEKDSDLLTRKGEIFRRQNKIDKAISCFNSAIQLDQNNAEAWRRKGFAHSMRHEDMSPAISCIDTSLEIDPYHPMTLVQKSIFLRRNKSNWSDALSCLDNALEIDPTFVLAWELKADIFKSMHNYELAMSCFENIVKLNPDDVKNWYNSCVIKSKFAEYEFQLAKTYFKKNDLETSLLHFNKVLSVDVDDLDSLSFKSKILLKLDRKNESQKCLERIKQLQQTT